MKTTRYLTLDSIQAAHPEIPAEIIGEAQHCCQPTGTDSAGNVLFSERLIVVAAQHLREKPQRAAHENSTLSPSRSAPSRRRDVEHR